MWNKHVRVRLRHNMSTKHDWMSTYLVFLLCALLLFFARSSTARESAPCPSCAPCPQDTPHRLVLFQTHQTRARPFHITQAHVEVPCTDLFDAFWLLLFYSGCSYLFACLGVTSVWMLRKSVWQNCPPKLQKRRDVCNKPCPSSPLHSPSTHRNKRTHHLPTHPT